VRSYPWSASDRYPAVPFPIVTALPVAPAREDAADAPPWPRLAVAGTALATAVGVVLAFAARSDLWLDEALSVSIARLPLGAIPDALREDGAPPLYYVLLHGWSAVLGTGDLAVRSLSALCFVGTLAAAVAVGRRFGGREVGVLMLLVVATSPYALRYATEARMYALVMLVVTVGILAFLRAWEQPSAGRVVAFGALVAVALYTQYWCFYLVGTVAVGLTVVWWRDRSAVAPRRLLGATVVGGLAFVPWVPIFVWQAGHTGTPWGTPVLPPLPVAYTLRDFAGGSPLELDLQEGWTLFLVLVPLLLLGVFGFGEDRSRIRLDLDGRPGARVLGAVGAVTLVGGAAASYLGGQAFQTRYAALVYPFAALLVARGIATFGDRRVLATVAAVVAALGLVGGVRNALTERTQAGAVAAVLRSDARPGDLVVLCPDQLGPGVARLAPGRVRLVTFPAFAAPERVDWVDYRARIDASDVERFATRAVRTAGSGTLWYVSSDDYDTHGDRCRRLGEALARRSNRARIARVVPDPYVFEAMGLVEIPPRAAG